MENIYLLLVALAVYCWIQAFRHIRYLLSFYGAKYPLGICFLAVAGGLTAGKPFTEGFVEFLFLSFSIWFALLIMKAAFALWQNPDFQRGRKNYNNLGALNEDWAPKSKSSVQLFGGAKPPSGPKPMKKSKPRSEETDVKANSAEPLQKESKRPKTDANLKKNTPYSKNHKTCSTCAFWTGEREIDPSRVVVRTSAPNTKGKCAGGGHNHAQVPASGTCSSYSKWTALN
jgi:hypothetical protein